jgi:hypothetical protein
VFSRWEYREYRRWRRRRKRRIILLLSAAFALAIAAAAHATSTHTGHGTTVRDDGRSHPAPHARRAKAADAGAARPSLSTAGAGLNWTDFYGIQLPDSAEDGPRHVRHGLAWGFSDTPGGALVAAVNIGVRTAALWGPAIYRPTIHHEVTGPGTGALLSADAGDYAALRAAARVRPGRPAGRGYAVEAAFRFATYKRTDATVDVVTEGPGTGSATVLVATRIELVWQRGDWRVVAPADGNWASSANAVSSLTGYIAFQDQG